MDDAFNHSKWSVRQYVNNKLETATKMISADDKQMQIDGLGTFYNFLGLKSICNLFATDYVDQYSYQGIVERIPLYLFMEIRKTMIGWLEDKMVIDKAVALYSNTLRVLM